MNRNTIELKRGFTLIEILIVIGVLAVIATVAVFILNPAQLFAQARDGQRLSDLQTINQALNLAVAADNNIVLGPANTCEDQSQSTIFVSVPSDNLEESPTPLPTGWTTYGRVAEANLRKVDASGWVPVAFTSIANPPLVKLPVDPINTFASGYYYAYVCGSYALSAAVESDKYLALAVADGGDDVNTIEMGTTAIPARTDEGGGGGEPTAPTVATGLVTNEGTTTATGNGNVTSDGGDAIVERGTVISTFPDPSITDVNDIKFTAAGTTGSFSTSMTELESGTIYNIRAYAFNSTGTSYGGNITFETESISATTPGAPTNVTGTAGDAQVTVSWTAPTSNGGSAIISYTATSSPGSFTCSSSVSPCPVTGLINGTAYTFTVTATNEVGTGPASDDSALITPIAPGQIVGWWKLDEIAGTDGANLVTNSGMETNIDGYTGVGALLSQDASTSHSGTASLKAVPNGLGSSEGARWTVSGLTAGKSYFVESWSRVFTSGQNTRLIIYNSTDSVTVQSVLGTPNSTTFKKQSATFVPIAGKTYWLLLYKNSSTSVVIPIYFDDISVQEIQAKDSVGVSHGTLNGGSAGGPTIGANGEAGTAFSFDGANDFIFIPDKSVFSIPTNGGMSLEFWMKRSNSAGAGDVFNKAANPYEWNVGITAGGKVNVTTWTSAGAVHASAETSASITDTTTFHHIVTTIATSSNKVTNIKIYIDGAIDTSQDFTSSNIISDTTSAVTIGKRGDGAGQGFFNGVVDEARIYNYALTAEEVSSRYQNP